MNRFLPSMNIKFEFKKSMTTSDWSLLIPQPGKFILILTIKHLKFRSSKMERGKEKITTHPLKWLNFKRQMIPCVDKDTEQLKHILLVGI